MMDTIQIEIRANSHCAKIAVGRHELCASAPTEKQCVLDANAQNQLEALELWDSVRKALMPVEHPEFAGGTLAEALALQLPFKAVDDRSVNFIRYGDSIINTCYDEYAIVQEYMEAVEDGAPTDLVTPSEVCTITVRHLTALNDDMNALRAKK